MVLGYNGLTTKYTTLLEDIHESSKYGFAALELRDYKLINYLENHSVNDLSQLFSTVKIRPVAINSIEIDEKSFNDNKGIINKLEWMSDIAEKIGCPYIVVAPMINGSKMDQARVNEHLVKIFREMSDIGRKYKNIKIGLEYIGLPDAMIKTLAEALDLLINIARENIGLVIDTFAFYANKSRPSDIKKINLKDLLLIHLNDSNASREDVILQESNRIFPGDGVVPFNEIIPEFVEIGYDGVYSIELINPQIWAWDASEVFRKSYSSLRSTMSHYY